MCHKIGKNESETYIHQILKRIGGGKKMLAKCFKVNTHQIPQQK